MTTTPLDHALIVLITILLPVHVLFVWYPRLVRAIGTRPGRARHEAYIQSTFALWGTAAIVLLAWGSLGRPLPDLGFRPPTGWGFWVGLVATVAIIVLLALQRRMLTRHPHQEEVQDTLRGQLESVRALLPHSRGELIHFGFLSLTAGVCEEILFRGFVIWYLGALVPFPAAVLISSLLFGMAHAYQGNRGVLQTGLVGLVLALLFVLTKSLWLPMALHAAVDLNSGILAYLFLRDERTRGESED